MSVVKKEEKSMNAVVSKDMSEVVKKRAVIRMGIVISNQTFNEAGHMLDEYVVGEWGGAIHRLDLEEAVLIEGRLNDELADDMMALQKKAQGVMAEFGKEVVLGEGSGRYIGDGGGKK